MVLRLKQFNTLTGSKIFTSLEYYDSSHGNPYNDPKTLDIAICLLMFMICSSFLVFFTDEISLTGEI